MSGGFRKGQLQQDIAFLLLRAGCAGSCDFTAARWTGMSSNAIVSVAYGGPQNAMPGDWADYLACVRTVRRLPRHRVTAKVREALRKARAAVHYSAEDRRKYFHEQRQKRRAA